MLKLSELQIERNRLIHQIDKLEDRLDNVVFAIAAMTALDIDRYNGTIDQLNDMYEKKLDEFGWESEYGDSLGNL